MRIPSRTRFEAFYRAFSPIVLAVLTLACPPAASAGADFALDFGGIDSYASFGSPPELKLSQLTIELWCRRDGTGISVNTGSGGISNIVPLVSRGRADGEDPLRDINYLLGIRASDGVPCADFEEGAGGTGSLSSNHPIIGTNSIGLGVWHHLAVTYDGTWRLYRDGLLEASVAVNQPMASASQLAVALASTLGQAGTPAGFFDGAVDEVRIWNVARTANAIRSTLNERVTTPQSGLVARWGLDEGTGSAVPASAGTTADGALTGFFWGWGPGAPFDAELPPLDPALVAPADQATGVVLAPELRVAVTDANGGLLDVTFHGRAVGGGPAFSVVGTATGVPSGSEAAVTWSGLAPLSGHEWYVTVADAGSQTTGPVWSFTTEAGTHTITASAGPNGSVDPSGAVVVANGATQDFTITAATGYHIADVLVDGGSVGAVPSYSFVNVTADHILAASFAINTYTLGASVVGNGTVGKAPDAPLYDHGTVVTLTATPSVGSHFVGWSGDVTGTESPLDVTMDAAKSVTATFALNTYALAVNVVGNGTVTRDPDAALYDHGTVVTLTATPAVGHHFVIWSGDASGATNPLDLTMDAAKSVTATFAINTYSLAVTVVGSGTVGKSLDQPLYDHGTNVTLTATPSAGFYFAGWSGDATGGTSPVVVAMTSAKSVTAHFVALSTQSLDVRVAFPDDDAEEEGDNDVVIGSSDLEMMEDGSTQHAVGLRFRGVSVPRNATITNATVQFTVRDVGSAATQLAIGVQAADNAAVFVETSGSLTSRALTPGTTSWTPANWPTLGAAGAAQRTPDFKARLQPVVNRAGWTSGNALVVIVTGTGLRVAESYDHSTTQAALLHVDYQDAAPVNLSPVVSAGPDRSVTLPASASLDGTVTDDGVPFGATSVTWSVASGPGSVSFTASNQVDTQASFGAIGLYRLVLTASDGVLVTRDSVDVTVSPSLAVVDGPAAVTALAASVLPQPVRGAGTLLLQLAAAGPLRAELFDIQGRRVEMLLDAASLPAGEHRLALGAARRLDPGLYFYRVIAGTTTRRGRFAVIE